MKPHAADNNAWSAMRVRDTLATCLKTVPINDLFLAKWIEMLRLAHNRSFEEYD